MKRLFVLLFIILNTSLIWSQDYVNVVARPGEDVQSLLSWYKLHEYQCNFDKFYEINNIKPNTQLKHNTVYKLPILLYRYNGKSIRTTISDEDINKALRIKAYNEQMLEIGLMTTNFVLNRALWVPIHEVKCKGGKAVSPSANTNTNPTTSTPTPPPIIAPLPPSLTQKPPDEQYAIFGKNQTVEMQSDKLKNAVYYIVAGHGGPDTGAIGSRSGKDLCEDEYAYDVSLRLAKNLLENGAKVYMITRDNNDGIRDGQYLPCDYDEVCWPNKKIPRGQKSRLNQRASAINSLYETHKARNAKVQRALMIHIDSRSKSNQTDVFFYHHPASRGGKKVANQLQETIKAQYQKHQPSRGYKGTVTARDLHMLRETNPTAVYIELGNIRHERDQRRFVVKDNRQAIANWLMDGLVEDYLKVR